MRRHRAGSSYRAPGHQVGFSNKEISRGACKESKKDKDAAASNIHPDACPLLRICSRRSSEHCVHLGGRLGLGRRGMEQPQHGRRHASPHQAGKVASNFSFIIVFLFLRAHSTSPSWQGGCHINCLPSSSDYSFFRSGMVLSQYYVQQVLMQSIIKRHTGL